MSLRIAFDLDGTLADLDSALAGIAERLFPPPSPATPGSAAGAGAGARPTGPQPADATEAAAEEQAATPAVRALDRGQQHAIWVEVRRTDGFWESLRETEPGVVRRIAEMAAASGWEVIFITQRPPAGGETTQRQTQRWLVTHGFDLPSVFVLGPGASRGKVAAALGLDVVVDDRTENCLDVKADSEARVFLIAPGRTPAVVANAKRLGIDVVNSMGECLDALASAGRKKAGILGRIKGSLGLGR